MNTRSAIITIILFCLVPAAAQRPPRPDGDGPRRPDWTIGVDTNKNGAVDADEFRTALARTFTEVDRNADGVIDRAEAPRPPGHHEGGPPAGRPGPPPRPEGRDFRPGDGPGRPDAERALLPPFFFMEKLDLSGRLTRAEFDRAATEVFASMDVDRDGSLSRAESRPPKGGGPGGPPPPPNARFVAAELRFGDKLVKNAPFSAETLIEDTRRLFDGTTVTRRSRGAIYRDTAGRTRREMPLEMVGGVSVVGENNKPQTLVFINDLDLQTQYFLDLNNKVARKNRIGDGRPPRDEPEAPDAKTESLGTKTIEGISVEGTRTTFEIPAGHIGNDKPMQVVTEKWFSPELQVLVMSRHVDPISGEHVFKLTNIRKGEPAADLFAVPAGFRVEERGDK